MTKEQWETLTTEEGTGKSEAPPKSDVFRLTASRLGFAASLSRPSTADGAPRAGLSLPTIGSGFKDDSEGSAFAAHATHIGGMGRGDASSGDGAAAAPTNSERPLLWGAAGGPPAATAAGGSSVSPSLPGSLQSSRPGTAGGGVSRPGTAQSLADAGIRDPLMHVCPKLAEKRCFKEEQLRHWEKQTLGSLDAIARQVQKTVERAEKDMSGMTEYLRKADEVLAKERELQARKAEADERLPPMPEEMPSEWGLEALDIMHPMKPPSPPDTGLGGRAKQRLLEAKQFGQEKATQSGQVSTDTEEVPEELLGHPLVCPEESEGRPAEVEEDSPLDAIGPRANSTTPVIIDGWRYPLGGTLCLSTWTSARRAGARPWAPRLWRPNVV